MRLFPANFPIRLLLAGSLAVGSLAQAQEFSDERYTLSSPFLGAPIERVVLAGATPELSAALLPLIETRAGEALRSETIREDVWRLVNSRLLKNVNVLAVPLVGSPLRVTLTYEVVDNDRLVDIALELPPGSRGPSDFEAFLREGVGKPINAIAFGQFVKEIEAKIVSAGYPNAKVTFALKPSGTGAVAATVHIEGGGPRSVVADLQVHGAHEVPQSVLRELVSGQVGEPFASSTVDNDIQILRSYFYDHGMIHADVTTRSYRSPDQGPAESPDEERDGQTVVFEINEGAVFRVGAFKLAEQKLGPEAELLALFEVRPRDIYSRAAFAGGVRKLEALARTKGIRIDVVPVVAIDERLRSVDLTLEIVEHPGS